ncbi:RNA exonuclease 5 [Mantella aurantiaca]
MSQKSIKQHKRPHSDEEKSTSKKINIQLESPEVNGISIQKTKKAPRLSPALFSDTYEIQHGSLRQLIKYAALGKEHTTQASWCSIHHQKRLHGVVVIVLEDMSQHHFYQFYTHFRCLRRLFQHRFSMPPPPSDFFASLVGMDVADKTRKEDPVNKVNYSSAIKRSLVHDPILQKYGKERHGLTRYLLSEEEMRKNDYPCIGIPDTDNFVQSNCMEEPTDNSPLFGLDCEMCLTTRGSELTRVSLVDANGNCIMDELVVPENPIRNYLTRFSGITKEMLLPVKTKLKDVQEKLKKLLPPDAVLVGHSLNNDLRALQMIHRNVIDTALLFAREFGRKFRLKFLAQAVLQRDIQSTDVVGHRPSEDAAAALKLAQYFIECGPEKVAQLNLESLFVDANTELNTKDNHGSEIKENGLVSHLNSQDMDPSSLVDALEKVGQKIMYVTRMEAVSSSTCLAQFENVFCASDEEVLKRAADVVRLSSVTIANYHPGSIFSRHSVGTNEKVIRKYEEMMTIFAGPFQEPVCLKSVKFHFQTCGPIHSINIILDTCQPYVCIKYSVLEAAQLAVKHLNGTYVNGCCIKVQRLITRLSVDYEDIIKDMEEDPENRDTIYVSGFMKPLTEKCLQQQFSHLKEIKAIFAPKNPRSGKHEKYCFIKLQSPESAAMAAAHISTHGGFMCQKAVTSSHFLHWFQEAVLGIPSHPESICKNTPKANLSEIIKNMDLKVNQIYKNLAVNTLCVILFPGISRDGGVLPGFGLMGIKTDHVYDL